MAPLHPNSAPKQPKLTKPAPEVPVVAGDDTQSQVIVASPTIAESAVVEAKSEITDVKVVEASIVAATVEISDRSFGGQKDIIDAEVLASVAVEGSPPILGNTTNTTAGGAVGMSATVMVGAAPAAPATGPRVITADDPDAMKALDYNKIWARLYQGSRPVDLTCDYAPFSMVVLCSEEWQPELPNYKGRLIRAGFNDTVTPTQKDLQTAVAAAEIVFSELVKGGTVLVTCTAGRNRSGLVTGLVLGRKLPAQDVVTAIRAARGPQALSNPMFLELVARTAISARPCATCSAQPRRVVNGIEQSTCDRCHAHAAAPPKKGVVSSVLGAVFKRTPNAPRGGAPRPPPIPGEGRGYFGKRRADRGAR